MPARHPIELVFPRLSDSGYRITSPADAAYNCIAWALGETDRRYDPAVGFDWPEGVRRSHDLASAVALLTRFGFEESKTADPEPGFEKIAIYGSAGQFSHVARLLPSGWWTSKLGAQVDIEHASVDDLSGQVYGHIVCYMRRKQSDKEPAQ